ncbi:MAG: DUF2771 family protein, partial [Rhodococcus sp.]|nr:DUF2771 family protein [Rhodococcus sp. (in: high G+C Gram-positive bacteria)]
CTEGPATVIDARPGQPLQLSLPKEISGAPWRLISVYGYTEADASVIFEPFRSGDASAVTVPAVVDDAPLVGVEIQLPSAVVDDEGVPLAHATWAIEVISQQG